MTQRQSRTAADVKDLVARQQATFHSGQTLNLAFRRDALLRLEQALRTREADLLDALQADLGKSGAEAYMCEIGLTLSELRHMLRHLRAYARQRTVPTPLSQFPARSFTVRQPYGVCLVMSPWNYPVLLTLEPLIGAIAAGNCCVVKPSAYAPATSRALGELLRACYSEDYIAVVEGGRTENQALLDQPFDKIFFTGSAAVGREVLRKASEHLIPVTLELGGKSPVLVDATADINLAARRIAFGKLLNAGQTCVAPDYVLVERSVKDALLQALVEAFDQMAGNALRNEQYVHIISRRHFDRLTALMDPRWVVYGGAWDADTLRIQPTLMADVPPDAPVMREEIFGPLLPVIAVDSLDSAFRFVDERPHPLACYLFSRDRQAQRRFVRELRFGGGCVNDTVIHLATSHMGFGGVGESGMGSYHGRRSFEAFSHEKSMVHKGPWPDLPVRYMPYTARKEAWLRRFLR